MSVSAPSCPPAAAARATQPSSKLSSAQQITCRITKLDVADEDVVVDRRVVLEEQARGELADRRAALKPGDTVNGTVRTLMPYGAFVEIEPGLDGLLHISDISRARVAKPEDVLSVGEQLTLRILKIDPETEKISLGLKQLAARAVGDRGGALLVPASASTATSRASPTLAHSSSSSPASKASSTFQKCRGPKKSAIPPTCSSEGDRVDAVVLSVKPPAGTSKAASRSASSKPSPTPGSKSSANSPSARKLKAPSPRS